MRQIKFRGKRIDNGEWVYGDLRQDPIAGLSIAELDISIPAYYRIKPATVGQFTGLHDRDGKEIYEGDILDFFDEGKLCRSAWLVKWDEEMPRFIMSRIKGKRVTPWGTTLESRDADTYVVIGNIHDNPDLLKGGSPC
ncbi:MAG: YopX family protein [Bacteroidales bacterium]|nr:YopX family protein [Bacteroidales bacterium]